VEELLSNLADLGPLTVQFLSEYPEVLTPISVVHEIQYLPGDPPPVQHLSVNPDLYPILGMVQSWLLTMW